MDLNSPVKMILPEDLKTPQAPDSEMYAESSTVGFAGDERKAGPGALPDSDANRMATAYPTRYFEANERVDFTGNLLVITDDDDKVVEILIRRPEDWDNECVKIVYDTTARDFTALDNALPHYYTRGSPEYTTRFETIKKKQEAACGPEYCGKLHMVVGLNGAGNVQVSCAYPIE